MEHLPPISYNTKRGNPPKLWYRERENVHQLIFQSINLLKDQHRNRTQTNRRYLALYENLDAFCKNQPDHLHNKLTFNVIRSVIDAVAAKIAKNTPKPEYSTNNAEYHLQHRAELLTDYIDGIFYQNQVYQTTPEVFLDALIFGTGVVQITNDGEIPKIERILIDEILVDEHDGKYRNPKQLIHIRPVFRDTLLQRAQQEEWSKDAIEAIQSCSPYQEETPLHDSTADRILIAEAYYLPNKDGKGGRHVVAIENHTLLDKPYTKPSHSYRFIRWSNKRQGFYGTGLAEELVPIQLEITKVVKHISKHQKHSGLKIFADIASEINPASLQSTNIPIIPVAGGQPPVGVTYPSVSPDTYQYLENLVRRAYELSGVSQMQAFAQRPQGITANAALQTLQDQQTERFILTAKRYEQFHLDISEAIVEECRAANAADGIPFQISVNRQGFFEKISWKDVDLKNEAYRLQCFPVSAFSSSPTVRLQQINDMMQLGLLPPNRAMQLMGDNPDFREFVTLETASTQRVRKQLELMKLEGVYTPPDEYMDLQDAIKTAQAEVNRSIVQNVPERRIQLIRRFVDEAMELLNPTPETASPVGQTSQLLASQTLDSGLTDAPPLPAGALPPADALAANALPPGPQAVNAAPLPS